MSINYNPRIVTDQLKLCLDAGNIKSYRWYENLLTYSEQFDNAAWGKSNSSVIPDQIVAPNGTSTADKIVENTANSLHFISQNLGTISGNYVVSCFVKAAERFRGYIQIFGSGGNAAVQFNLNTGTITGGSGTTTITPYPNGWYKVSASVNFTSAAAVCYFVLLDDSGAGTYTGNGTSGMYLWGTQVEQGSVAKDYYATTNIAKARETTWTDLSGLGNTGTLASLPTYNNSNGGSLNFVISNSDHVSCSPFSRSTSMSMEVWFNASSVSIARQYLYTQQTDPPNLAVYAFQQRQGCQLENGKVVFQYFNVVDNSFYVTTDEIIQSNVWYQFVATLNGSSYQLYLNGNTTNMIPNTTDNTFVSTNPQAKLFTPNEAFIARRADAQAEDRFGGKIAIVREYSKALTAAEVKQNFNAVRNRFGI